MSKKKVVLFGAIIVLVLAAGATAWLYISNHSTTKQVAGLCGGSVLTSYNTIFTATSLEQHTERFETVVKTVQGIENHSSDPTCEFILFSYHLDKNDFSAAQSSLDKVKSAADKGNFVDTRLANVSSITASQDTLDSMKAAKERDESGGGSGNEVVPGEGNGRG